MAFVWYAVLQFLVLAAILLWSGAFKLLSGSMPAAARRSAAAGLIGADRAVWLYRIVGVVELGLAVGLLLPATGAGTALGTAALSAGFVGYLGYARSAAPTSGCGCLSARRTPVGTRGIARALLMMGAGLLGATASGAGIGWPSVLANRPGPAALVLLAEAVGFVLLSPELDDRWLVPLRRWRVRRRHPLANGSSGAGPLASAVPVAASVQQLLRSPAYQAVAGVLRSDLLESWEDGDWRVLTYRARHGDRDVLAVFAVPLLAYQPDSVRAVLTDVEADTEGVASIRWQYVPEPADGLLVTG